MTLPSPPKGKAETWTNPDSYVALQRSGFPCGDNLLDAFYDRLEVVFVIDLLFRGKAFDVYHECFLEEV